MSLNEYLGQIRVEVGNEQYNRWDSQARSAYDSLAKQSKHWRQRGEHHDPHAPRAQTIGGLIVAMYELAKAGEHDVVVELKPRELSARPSPAYTDSLAGKT